MPRSNEQVCAAANSNTFSLRFHFSFFPEAKAHELAASKPVDSQPIRTAPTVTPDDTNVEMTASEETIANQATARATSISKQEAINVPKPAPTNTTERKQAVDNTLANPCAICMAEEKRLACMPCGHLAACVSCGHSLRCCPICRREIQAFVKIYI